MTIDPISAILSTYQPPIWQVPPDEPHWPTVTWGADTFTRIGKGFDCEN